MAGTRRGARSVMKWFAAVYVVLIVVQVFLAGEGIFGLNAIKHSDDCDKKGADPTHLGRRPLGNPARHTHDLLHRRIVRERRDGARADVPRCPDAILFLIVALLAWHPVSRVRIVSIVLPFLAFVQMLLPGAGRWVAALHPVNAILLLGLFGWLFYTLRREQPADATATAPVGAPTG